MRVISICHRDYANYAYLVSRSLMMAGMDSEALVLKSHPYGYGKCARRVSYRDMRSEIRKADVVQIMHNDITMLDICKSANKTPDIVYYTGTKYRQNPEHYNIVFNNIVKKSVVALGEFYDNGAKNRIYMAPMIDTDMIKADYTYEDRYRCFRHHPSNAGTKGTQTIVSLMAQLPQEYKERIRFKYSNNGGRKRYPNQLARMRQCHVYIELYKLRQLLKPYGSYGMSCLEACAMGKVVITNNLWTDVYLDHYPSIPLRIANTGEVFTSKVMELVDMSDEELLKLQRQHRRWVARYHGLRPTGEYIKKNILSDL